MPRLNHSRALARPAPRIAVDLTLVRATDAPAPPRRMTVCPRLLLSPSSALIK